MNYKLLFTDFDNTLVGKDLLISNENLNAIKKAQEIGLKIMLCTGRSFLKLKQFEDIMGISGNNLYGIAFNGGIVYKVDSREIIRDKRLDKNLGRSIIEKLRDKDVSIMVYVKERLYCERLKDRYIDFYSNKASIDITYLDSFNEIEEDYSKILAINENHILLDVYRSLESEMEGKCNMFLSASSLLEFTQLNVTKGDGIKFVSDLMGVKSEEIIAVGDNQNDIPMIKYAGLGIAVNNAVEELKICAEYITEKRCEEGAISEVIEKFIV